MLICEEFFLLATNDRGKPEVLGSYRNYGLAGALVADLLLAGRLGLSEDRDPRLHVLSTEPTGNAVLDRGLAVLATREGKKLSSVVAWSKANPEESVAAALADAGVITVNTDHLLGLSWSRYPALDPAPEEAIRERLAAVVTGRTAPTDADRALLGLLLGTEIAHRVLPEERTGLRKRDLAHRIKEVASGDDAGTAVTRAVATMNAAIFSAVIVPVIASN